MDQLRKVLVHQTRLRLTETWLSRIHMLSTWLDELASELASEHAIDNTDQSPSQSTDELPTPDPSHPKKRRTLNTSSDNISCPSSILPLSFSALKTGQARVKRECFRVLRACDETRVLVNLRFSDTPSHALRVFEGLLSLQILSKALCLAA